MTAIEANPEATPIADEPEATAPEPDASASKPAVVAEEAEAREAEPLADEPAIDETGDSEGTRPDRRKLEEQLEALKRKELELRRALLIADHPELADAIRTLEGCVYAVSRAEAKLRQGLSKAEARRREVLDKKLAGLRQKRAELDAQIEELERELASLGAERLTTFEAERKRALEQLLVALGTHEVALAEAGLDPATLVPELSRWLPEIESLAERIVAARASDGGETGAPASDGTEAEPPIAQA